MKQHSSRSHAAKRQPRSGEDCSPHGSQDGLCEDLSKLSQLKRPLREREVRSHREHGLHLKTGNLTVPRGLYVRFVPYEQGGGIRAPDASEGRARPLHVAWAHHIVQHECQ